MAFDLKTVKTILQIEDTNSDNYIKIMIPIVQDYIFTNCNITVADWKVSLDLVGSQMIQYHMNVRAGVTSEGIGDSSESYTEDYPASILNSLKSFRKAKFV